MNLRIQNPGQPADPLSNSPLSNAKTGGAQNASPTYSSIGSLDTQDTASISAAPSQLSGDLPIRQDRVDALRAQIDSGTYTVDPRAVANAMFQNLFRS
jgi:flagellar biosynthesis anti-sigma factor FlgM